MTELEYTVETIHTVKQEGSTLELSRGTSVSRYPLQSLAFVNASDLVPEEWSGWFWNDLANCDVTWGDAAYTIVDYWYFVECCREILSGFPDPEDYSELTEEYTKWLETLESDTDTQWVNLEA